MIGLKGILKPRIVSERSANPLNVDFDDMIEFWKRLYVPISYICIVLGVGYTSKDIQANVDTSVYIFFFFLALINKLHVSRLADSNAPPAVLIPIKPLVYQSCVLFNLYLFDGVYVDVPMLNCLYWKRHLYYVCFCKCLYSQSIGLIRIQMQLQWQYRWSFTTSHVCIVTKPVSEISNLWHSPHF